MKILKAPVLVYGHAHVPGRVRRDRNHGVCRHGGLWAPSPLPASMIPTAIGIFYNSSASFNGNIAGGANQNKYRMYVDGETAYCIEPGIPLRTGDTLRKDSSETWNALSSEQKKAVGLALLYGRQGNRANLSGNDDEQWLATQTLVWEFVTGCRNATGSFEQVDTKVYSLHFGENQPNSGARAVYDQIVSPLAAPSYRAQLYERRAYRPGVSGWEIHGNPHRYRRVLSEYDFTSSDSSVALGRNTLTISADHAISGSIRNEKQHPGK